MSTRATELKYTLVRNGLDFVVSAVAAINRGDSSNGDQKYAVLHLWSGVLLLLKERVRREHWTLLFSKSEQINLEAYESGDFQSIGFEQIEKVLREVCGIKLTDESKVTLSALRKKRNGVEHFSFELNISAIKSLVARVLHFLVSFIDEHLEPEEFTGEENELLGRAKEQMREFDEFVRHRMGEIERQLREFDGRVLYCPSCGNKALISDDRRVYKCRFCLEANEDYSQIANDYLERELGLSSYLEIKDGGEWPQYECIECGEESMIPADEDRSEFFCVACDCTYSSDEVQYCSRCGSFSSENETGLCDACVDDRLRDDD